MSETTDARMERARLRRRIAGEVIDWCRRRDELEPTAAALELHDAHARHARELGRPEAAAQAEARYDRALRRQSRC